MKRQIGHGLLLAGIFLIIGWLRMPLGLSIAVGVLFVGGLDLVLVEEAVRATIHKTDSPLKSWERDTHKLWSKPVDIDHCPKCGEYLHDEVGHSCP